MKKNIYIVFSFILISCSASDVGSLKPSQFYSTENVDIKSKKVVDAEITFVNGERVKTKLQALKTVFGDLDEASITQYFAIYDKNGKRNFLRNNVIKEMKVLDYANVERVFVNRLNHPNALQELVYNGKIKWYVEHTYIGLKKREINYFVDDEGREIQWNNFNFKKRFKDFIYSNPKITEDIENINQYDKSEIVKVLKKYENL